jgi:acyl carrier protein
MSDTSSLKQAIKELLVRDLMLQIGPDAIGDNQPLFGPESLGLDSVDALQIVVALDKNYGLKIIDPAMAKDILQNVSTIAETIERHRRGEPILRPPAQG